MARRTTIPLCKVCNVEDFADPDLRATIRSVFAHEIGRFGPEFPTGVEYRKHWEVGMAVLAFGAHGLLNRRSEILGVGAGNEPTCFWLTRHVRRVFATDLYLAQDDWDESSNPAMLTDPARYWPAPWDPRRLVVQHMDGRDLRHPDGSFDGVFSSGSIEHFGAIDDVARSMAEIGRVLRPGGLAALSTEFRLAGDGRGLPGTLMFDNAQLEELIAASGLEPVGPLDVRVSDRTLAGCLSFERALANVRAHVEAHGEIVFHELDWPQYPCLVLEEGGYTWTSVHLTLRKPGHRRRVRGRTRQRPVG